MHFTDRREQPAAVATAIATAAPNKQPALDPDLAAAVVPADAAVAVPAVELEHDFFLSHFQATGGDQVVLLWAAPACAPFLVSLSAGWVL